MRLRFLGILCLVRAQEKRIEKVVLGKNFVYDIQDAWTGMDFFLGEIYSSNLTKK